MVYGELRKNVINNIYEQYRKGVSSTKIITKWAWCWVPPIHWMELVSCTDYGAVLKTNIDTRNFYTIFLREFRHFISYS